MKDLKEVKPENLNNNIHNAVREGYLQSVKYLVEFCNANFDEKNIDGDTPIQIAKERGHPYSIIFDGATQTVVENK